MDWLTAVFGQKNEITTLQECARAILIFVYGLLLVRIAGRRLFGKWAALDIVVAIMVGSNLSRALTGGAPLAGTLAATTLLIAIHWALAWLAARNPTLSRILEGRAIVLACRGDMNHANRKWHAISEADIAEALRQAGVGNAEQAEQIMLEPGGKITILKRKG